MRVIEFEFESEFGVYRDAIVLADDEVVSDEQLQQMKQERFDAWMYMAKNPPVEAPAPPAPAFDMEINGEQYQILKSEPLPGSKLISVDGIWYFKVN